MPVVSSAEEEVRRYTLHANLNEGVDAGMIWWAVVN